MQIALLVCKSHQHIVTVLVELGTVHGKKKRRGKKAFVISDVENHKMSRFREKPMGVKTVVMQSTNPELVKVLSW